VDGVTRFDRELDPDDMRLRVDPEAAVDASTHGTHQHGVRCMQGAFLQATQRGLQLQHAY